MAKLTVTVTVTVILFTLAVSVVSSKPEKEIVADHLTTFSAEPDPVTTNPTSSDDVTIPVNFHPINRHFPRRPLMTTAPFNHRRHELSRRGLQIPYGNDMIFSGEEKATGTDPSSDGVDIPAIKMFVGPFASEETKHHPGREIDSGGEVMMITVKLIKRQEEGESERENMFRTKIRKFLNHLV
ncbi:hypothetical protein EUTSA_v10028294mg [Eutrema salsugineum]|uniref:Uncharacterized protein n=1 Tax=Eutrema salsugineum TaxID=72664 RepID=V4L8L0_EUTSA|nr:uncharacterized protein LOC18022856 [Eutrema salsugineum]ESQ46755.1 hypothetical protein EUTSA_v10028294mg [Eutrema salsugineum]